MYFNSYNDLENNSNSKQSLKDYIGNANSMIPTISKILQNNWEKHAPNSPANFSQLLNIYYNNPYQLENSPHYLDSLESFNKDVGCDLKKPHTGINSTMIKAFIEILKYKAEGVKDLIDICSDYSLNQNDANIYCSNNFIQAINDHFLGLANLCE